MSHRLFTPSLTALVLSPTLFAQGELGPRGQPLVPRQEATLAPDQQSIPPLVLASEASTPRLAPGLGRALPAQREARYVVGPDGDRLVELLPAALAGLSFAGGDYLPPPGERLDPELVHQAVLPSADGRPTAERFALAILSERLSEELVQRLEQAGARILGLHATNVLKLAVQRDTLSALADEPALSWVGYARPTQKLHPALASNLLGADPLAEVEVIVSLFDSDLSSASTAERIGSVEHVSPEGRGLSPQAEQQLPLVRHSNGWQQHALESLGLSVQSYNEEQRAFHAKLTPSQLERLLALDFVLFVEGDPEKGSLHDDSVPMIGNDLARYYINGGSSHGASAGILDSGVDYGHTDVNSHVYGVGWELGGSGGAWYDVCEHGTHVAGTILGNGNADLTLRGNAFGLGYGPSARFYNIKVSNGCSGWSFDMQTASDIFSTSYYDGSAYSARPHVINNSWGGGGGQAWYGSEYDARVIDSSVFADAQIYAFAAGNNGPNGSTILLQGSAKNALTVGSVDKIWSPGSTLPGIVSSFSSRGPTADLRWKPNVSAPGSTIRSLDANSTNGYTYKSGTSMATPHVTAVAAEVMDQYAWLKYVPERVASLLMATALTKDDVVLTTPSDQHLRDYGTGRVDPWRALYASGASTWSSWGAWLPAGNYTYADFTVPAGCTRIIACMHYVEPAASSGASHALLSNYDLFLDQPPIDGNFNTGEWVAQQSSRDNTEIRVLNNPATGTWRWKIWPTNAPTGVYYGMTVAYCFGDTTPDLDLTASVSKHKLKPNEITEFTVTVHNPGVAAENVVVEPSAWALGQGAVYGRTKFLADGIVVSNPTVGIDLPLLYGYLGNGWTRSGVFQVAYAQEGTFPFVANLRGEALVPENVLVYVTVDGTPPSLPGNVRSTTHDANGFSCESAITMRWDPSTDTLAGVAGYRVVFDQSAGTNVSSGTPNVDGGTQQYSTTLAPSAQPYWFHIAAVDECGNWCNTVTVGPYTIGTGGVSLYCIGAPNSQGLGADIGTSGSTSVSANDLVLTATGLPHNKPGLFYYGTNQTQVAFGNGFRCVSGGIKRLPIINTGNGTTAYAVDYANLPTGGQILPGSTWNFQFWYRDPAAGGSAFNYSNAASIRFCD